MVIDFHSHIFPEKIASQTLDKLTKPMGVLPNTNGTELGLVESMKNAGVDISVTLPVLTKPSQFEHVNNYAKSITEKYKNSCPKIISFAGMHPDSEDIDGDMKRIKEMGFLGIKVHPDYQNAKFNDPKYIRILECAKEYDLIVVTHSGWDNAYEDVSINCTPDYIIDAIKKSKHNKVVLGHFGANRMWGEVYEKLCDLDVYFDTALAFNAVDKELFCKIVEKHGDDKIVFATDSPWANQSWFVRVLKTYNLSEETMQKIYYKNALKLLKLDK